MASVPNRVYPMSEFGEIRTNTLRASTTVADNTTGVSGSFSVKVRAPLLNISTTNNVIPSGSMYPGDIAIATGSAGTSATLYICIRSGSGEAIYSADLTYVSTGSHY
jgi:hypothetical protein